jgi:hypothetical protein
MKGGTETVPALELMATMSRRWPALRLQMKVSVTLSGPATFVWMKSSSSG